MWLQACRIVIQQSFSRVLEANMGAPGAALVIPISAGARGQINGSDFSDKTAIIFRGIVPTRFIELQPDTYALLRFESAMRHRGWVDFDKGLDLVHDNPLALDRVRSVLHTIFATASNCTKIHEFEKFVLDEQDQLLSALDKVMAPRVSAGKVSLSHLRYERLVQNIDELVRSNPRVDVLELIQGLGVSARTLHTAVTRVKGVSLYRYVILSRLWRLRLQLSRGLPGQTIKQTALNSGFGHMGELSRQYKSVFGESPSDTLRRVRS